MENVAFVAAAVICGARGFENSKNKNKLGQDDA
jgi:hypothetical protein